MNVTIKNRNDLIQVKDTFLQKVQSVAYRLLICSGTGCTSANCAAVKDALIKELASKNLTDKVLISITGCRGSCNLGPLMEVMPDEVLYTKLSPEDVPKIVSSHFLNGNIVEEKTYFDQVKKQYFSNVKDINFYNRQERLVLKNCGMVDCHLLEDYVSKDGYFALHKALTTMSPTRVIQEIKISGLRGRGGAGFPTGVKWEAGYNAQADEKYIVCNCDEGDPGAFMDRSVMESVPHSVVEGMIIGGYAIGASKGVAYIRAEYDLAVERFNTAIETARAAGILGHDIFGSGFDFDIEIRIGAGAFVCGEETALMSSVEGKRGEPKQKPPFPFQKGLFGKPTIINNVETLANIAPIVMNGGAWYAGFGTEGSKGTKVFALAGDIVNTGLIEVPMGVSLGEIIFDIGGGIPKNKTFKAAQTGGPSGGCITKANLNIPVDYESLSKLGTIMGSGGLISMDDDTCMVDMARYFMEFVQDESCGKCVPCRIGTKRMLEILERITRGQGKEGDIELLLELGDAIRNSAMCGLGQTAPNPVVSIINNFREEFEEHIHNTYCRAGVCSEMFISPCENACPASVNVPGYMGLIAVGRYIDAYHLVREENPFPAICGRICTHPCESKCRRAQLDEAIAIADLKRFVADYAFKHEEEFTKDIVFPKNGKSVGIIGAGPSGLTCGYYLARLGYTVEVYEAAPVAGGVLAFGIPEYRLPKDVLAHEIKLIEQVGVKIHLNCEVGKNISFAELRNQHHSIYIATGTQLSNKINIPGEDLSGVIHGLNFLRNVNLGNTIHIGETVAVIGGGNTAIDAARTVLRLGAKKVIVLYRRTVEDMPADAREINDMIEEGVEIIPLVAPVRFIGKEAIEEIECVRMELCGFDSAGRRKPKIQEGSNFTINVDMVIPAVSQSSDLPFVKKEEVEMTEWGTFITDKETLMTTMEGVFAGGDVARGSDVAITAIADGKKAAISIDLYLGGKGVLNKGEAIAIPAPADQDELVEHARFPMEVIEPEKRKDCFCEVVQGYHKLNAIAESMRCLRCDRR
ncbi:FAD-dependent oxidoreductase [Dehalobacter sp. DCM]|uniref:NADH-ubiquinone oxidoreductase-F iron-sulfur binding region domain-containing protein n=1 Tax=Dehalobacter sp. DCM TaxID=2907827 RepID=UPI0030817770|nr:FAD-dependent oxidoreductase [Dehalobacter sp. DCM]